MVAIGANLRDKTIWQYPILPGAITVFQQLASSREWTISGAPKQVPRAVEWLNRTKTVHPESGMVYLGFEQYLKRRALDYLLIGRTAFLCSRKKVRGEIAPLQYLDPARLSMTRERRFAVLNTQYPAEVKPNEKLWVYAGNQEYRYDEVHIDHPIPIGTDSFISPTLHLLPSAILAWLLREHDSASIDGRKLREIFLVANNGLKTAIDEALLSQVALWSGADPEQVGVPVVSVQHQGSQSLESLFTRLGISSVPEHFSREEFTFYYVNEIAAALSLALRHFWNNERTTNRALEVVQEQRQQQKGPSIFVRSEQRAINNSGVLDEFSSRGRSVRFAFIEETDSSSMKDQAEVVDKFASALGKISTSFNGVVSLPSLVAWFQSLGLLPNELELISETASEMNAMESSDPNFLQEGEVAQESDPIPTTAPDTLTPEEKFLLYGEIKMNGEGQIVERRNRVYSFSDVLQKSYTKEDESEPVPEELAEDFFAKAIIQAEAQNRAVFSKTLQDDPEQIRRVLGEPDEWMQDVSEQKLLTPEQQLIVDLFIQEVRHAANFAR